MTELKPCPFCGRIPTVDDCGDNRFFVRCKCGIAQDKLYGQRCDAVRRWNTRRQQPEPKKGKWLERSVDVDGKKSIEEWQSAKCSVCGLYHTTPYLYYFDDFNFCPNCGAKMEESNGNNT